MLPDVGAASPQEGTASNRYAILGRIATGGMAEIFLARSTSLTGVERYVVLKRVLPERTRDPIFVKMFLDEARLAAQLQHPNIAQVHDIGRLGDSYFFTMEYVHGEDLRALLQRLAGLRRALPVNHALLIAAGAAAALHHAHDRTGADRKPLGIVHRDVSPSNVMVSFEGGIKLVDFGVAKASQKSTETRTGTVKGKIAYLSPEQCKGGAVDRRSDVFSLGIVLYELLTGARLWKRDTDFATMTAIVSEDAPAPSLLRPELGPAIDAVVQTALARDPGRRFATAAEMLEAIEAAAEADGKTMSAHGLGRFLRELFGERPEPWVELDVSDDAPEIVTVTSQSVLLADAFAGAAALPAVGAGAGAVDGPGSGAYTDVEDGLRRASLLRRAEPGSESGASLPGVAPLPPVPAAPPMRLETPTAAWAGAQRTIRSTSPPPPLGSPPPPDSPGPVGPPFGPRLRPPPSYPPSFAPAPTPTGQPIMPTTYPSYAAMARPALAPGAAPARRQRRRWIGVAIGGAAVAIGVMIGVFAAGDDDRRRRAAGPAPAVAATEPVDAVVAVAPAEAALAAAVGVVVAGAVAPPDAASAAAVAVVAAVARPPRDPAPAVVAAVARPPRDPAPVVSGRDPRADRAADRAAAIRAITRAAERGEWATAIKGCGALGKRDLTAAVRLACAQAACGQHDKAAALSYLKSVPRKSQAAAEKACAARGVVLRPPAAKKDPCEADPLSCQH